MLTVGDRLPEFDLQATISLDRGKEFTQISNQSYPGQWLVLFSWPMDFTFVCPTEIAEFGKRNEDFRERDAQVLGMSTDTHFVHLAWRRDHADLKTLPFPMLADTKRELSTALGILHRGEGGAAAGHLHRGSAGCHPLGQRQRPLGRSQRGRGGARARRAPDRRALPVQLEGGRAHAAGGVTWTRSSSFAQRFPTRRRTSA